MDGGLILAGDVRIGFYNPQGAFLGYAQEPINTTQLTLTPGEGEQRDRLSRQRDTYGQALDSITLPAPWTLSWTVDTLSRDILRGMFLGVDEDIAVSSGSVTDESITARLGKWVPLENVMLESTPAVVVSDDPETTTYTIDTDYLIDYRNGQILAIEGGAISEGDPLLVDYSYGGRDGFRVNGARTESLEVAMLLDGRSLRPSDQGKVIRMIAPRINLRPGGGNDLMSDEWVAPEFTGTMVTPAGESQPFQYEVYEESA